MVRLCVLYHGQFVDLSIQVSTASSSSAEERPADALTRSRQAFNLTCAEQLVPLLSLDTIEHRVFPLCLPYARIISLTASF
jgi:hypothetical protein